MVMEKLLPSDTVWLLRTLVVGQMAVIVTMATFYVTGYSTLVTKEELNVLPYPYNPDKAMIMQHIARSEVEMDAHEAQMRGLSKAMAAQTHKIQLRLDRLEWRVKQQGK
jgi:hypothetical protein